MVGCCSPKTAAPRTLRRARLLGTRSARRERNFLATEKQRAAARKNVKKAAAAAKRKKTIKHLPKKTRTALGKQANKVKRRKRAKR